jgi:hypothetical protein
LFSNFKGYIRIGLKVEICNYGLFASQRGLGALTQAGPSDHQALKIDGLESCLA